MASDGMKGFGTTIKYAAVGVTPDTLIAQVMDVSGPSIAVDDVEITNNDSPSEYKEYVPGLKDGGEVSFDIIYEESQCSTLYGLVGTKKDWRITKPDNSYIGFTGYIKGLGDETPMNDAVKNSITIKITGAPTFTSA